MNMNDLKMESNGGGRIFTKTTHILLHKKLNERIGHCQAILIVQGVWDKSMPGIGRTCEVMEVKRDMLNFI
jgi:hypothetical protein